MTREELAALAEKYATLGELRRARARGEEPPPARVFKELARRFPGCLRELDTLPMETIDARRDALHIAAEGGPIEPWMTWLSEYHAKVREVLVAKVRGRAARASGEARVRINEQVFAELSRAHGVPAEAISRAIFPRSRR